MNFRKRSVILAGLIALGPMATAYADDATPLVSTAWLSDNLQSADLVVLDIRNRIDGGSLEVFQAGHIPGAVYSNYAEDGWRAERDGVVGMLPEIADLETLIGGLGIDNDDHVVIVPAGTSSTDFGSATRVYWTFKVLGHDAVSILDGGFAAWSDASLPVAQSEFAAEPATFTATFRPELLATTADVRAAIDAEGVALVDARPLEQFSGEAVSNVVARAGTLPGAVNLQQQTLVTDDAVAIRAETLDGLVAAVGLTEDTPQIAFCNTGHWASIAWFAASELAGHDDVRLYDASMTGWAADAENPMISGVSN